MEKAKETTGRQRGRPATRKDLPDGKQKRAHTFYCSAEEAAEIRRILQGWRQQDKIAAEAKVIFAEREATGENP